MKIVEIDVTRRFSVATDPADPLDLRSHVSSELWMWELLLRQIRTGDVVVDLGAHLGSFSVHAAAHGAVVLAVEAGESNVKFLLETVRLNPMLDICVFHRAAWSTKTVLKFAQKHAWGMIAQGDSQEILRHLDRSSSDVLEVQAEPVDDIVGDLLDRVSCVKIDVEGAEPEAVKGMTRILEREIDVLYETNGHTLHLLGGNIQDLRRQFTAAGYTSYLVHEKALYRLEDGDTQPTIYSDCLATRRDPRRLGVPVHDRMSNDFMVKEMIRSMGLPVGRAHVEREPEKRPDLRTPAMVQALARR